MGHEGTTHTYKVVDGCEVKLDVFRPADAVVRPVVVWIHGGALVQGSRHDWPGLVAFYVDQGYCYVSIDYRLAPETMAPAIVEDIVDAVAWIRKEGPSRFHVDPNRLAVTGGSAGGYLALMAGWRVQPPPQAMVSFCGYGEILGPWLAEPDPFYCQQPAIAFRT